MRLFSHTKITYLLFKYFLQVLLLTRFIKRSVKPCLLLLNKYTNRQGGANHSERPAASWKQGYSVPLARTTIDFYSVVGAKNSG